MLETSDELEIESWIRAEKLVDGVGALPTIFTAPIRAIRAAPSILKTNDPAALRKFEMEVLKFPLNISPTLRAALYFIGQDLYASSLTSMSPITLRGLLELYSSDELLCAVGLGFLTPMIRRRCDRDEWKRHAERFGICVRLSALVGQHVAPLGRGHGLMIGALRMLAQGILMFHNLEGFKKYRRALAGSQNPSDVEYEMKHFGCTHYQIASLLASKIGYGLGPRVAFGVDMKMRVFKRFQAAIDEMNQEIINWRLGIKLPDMLLGGGDVGMQMETESRTIPRESIKRLSEDAAAAISNREGLLWLERTLKDVPEHVAMQLGIKPVDDMVSDQ